MRKRKHDRKRDLRTGRETNVDNTLINILPEIIVIATAIIGILYSNFQIIKL